jgi:hypothetical protein
MTRPGTGAGSDVAHGDQFDINEIIDYNDGMQTEAPI